RQCIQIIFFGYSGGVTITAGHSSPASAWHVDRSMNRMELLACGPRRQHLWQVFISPLFGGQPFPFPNPVHLRITKRIAVRGAKNVSGPLSGLNPVTVVVAIDAGV